MLKKIRNEEGFTLLEVVIAVNLSLIVIGIVFSFILFIGKFTHSLDRKLDRKSTVYAFLYGLEKKLDNSEEFRFEIYNNNLNLVVNNKEIIYFGKSEISSNSEILLSDLGYIELSIITDSEYLYRNGEIVKGRFDSANSNIIKNEDIKEIKIILNYHGKKIEYNYSVFRYSTKQFKNLNENAF